MTARSPAGRASTLQPDTRTLLWCGVVAGPLYVVVGATQMLIRDGYDITRHALSWHGALHLVAATVAFLSLVAACLVLARRYLATGHRGRAVYAVATGVLFLVAFLGLLSGSGQAWIAVAFSVAILLGWTWVSVTAAQLLGALPGRNGI